MTTVDACSLRAVKLTGLKRWLSRWNPDDLSSRNLHVRREAGTGCPLTFTHMLWHVQRETEKESQRQGRKKERNIDRDHTATKSCGQAPHQASFPQSHTLTKLHVDLVPGEATITFFYSHQVGTDHWKSLRLKRTVSGIVTSS